jgi:hypothetical protein
MSHTINMALSFAFTYSLLYKQENIFKVEQAVRGVLLLKV